MSSSRKLHLKLLTQLTLTSDHIANSDDDDDDNEYATDYELQDDPSDAFMAGASLPVCYYPR